MDDKRTKESEFAYNNEAFSASSGSSESAEITKAQIAEIREIIGAETSELPHRDLHVNENGLAPTNITQDIPSEVHNNCKFVVEDETPNEQSRKVEETSHHNQGEETEEKGQVHSSESRIPPITFVDGSALQQNEFENYDNPVPRKRSQGGTFYLKLDDESFWHQYVEKLKSKKVSKNEDFKKLPKKLRKFYKRQNKIITSFESSIYGDPEEEEEDDENVGVLSKVIFLINFLLLVGKATAAGLSDSLSIVSSVIDSCMDLVSGALIWWSSKAIRKNNKYRYPTGRTRLEPMAILILSVGMTVASFQVIAEAINKSIRFSKDSSLGLDFGTETIAIVCSTIGIKLIVFCVASRFDSSSARALAQDQRNDVVSNSVALMCGLIGARIWKYADPIGATLISIYIIVTWVMTGKEQIQFLTGYTARPDDMKLITWVALTHHEKVLAVDTVRAFHSGNDLLVEVHIVLPEDMKVRESHDIAETLQLKLEELQAVERAFVHIDYESTHKPDSEHKAV